MSARRTLIAANWKMNGDLALLDSMLSTINTSGLSDNVDVLICPAFTLLGSFAKDSSSVLKGAQNVSQFDSGAYTGEISIEMLKACHCEYVLVGHSERRELFQESNEVVAEKFQRITQANMKTVLCLGESLAEREAEQTKNVLAQQLDTVLNVSSAEQWQNVVIAYEPVWAIGTGKTATPEMAQETHEFIRQYLRSNTTTEQFADTIQILYGGSMKPANAADLLAQNDIDGGLVGGASLDPESFVAILKAAS